MQTLELKEPVKESVENSAPLAELPGAPFKLGAEISYRLRTPGRSLTLSVGLHAAVLTAMAFIRPSPVMQSASAPAAEARRNEIRIGKQLFFVARIAGSQPRTSQAALTSPQRPGAQAARRAAPQTEAKEPTQTPVPDPTPKPAARVFVPPEIKRRPAITQTLVQSLSPPETEAQPVTLPSFRIISELQVPKIPKPFFAPGRKTPAAPTQVQEVTPLSLDVNRPVTPPTVAQPKLTLPQAAPPVDTTPPTTPVKAPAGPASSEGEPITILSLNDRKIPIPERLVLPEGNIAPESKQTSPDGEGTGTGSAARPGASPAKPVGSPGGAPSNKPGAPNATGGSGSASPNAGGKSATSGGVIVEGLGSTSSGGGAGSVSITNGSGPSPVGSRTGSPTGSANTGSSGTGNVDSGNGGGRTAPGQIMNRPITGSYDAIVVQTAAPEQFPESKALLTGRPVYSVYIHAGAERDWTLYYCVPNEKGAPVNTSSVVNLDTSKPKPVDAPYAYKLMRPDIKLPTYERYVLVHGRVNAQGRFENLKMVRSIQPEIDRAVLATLDRWEFRAAARDGAPLAVEFLLSIPAKGL